MATNALPKLFALIALLAAIGAAALLYFAPPPAAAQTTPTDYDANDNGLIEIRNPAQLSAMRHDLNGNGDATHADYIAAFPDRDTNAASRMGCPAGNCRGYELLADLDLSATGTAYNPWTPIGTTSTATFDGNGRTITGLTVNVAGHAGLFSGLGSGGVIRNLGLVNPDVRSTAPDGEGLVGPLAAIIGPGGVAATSYVSGGTTTLANNTAIGGGLVGRNLGFIRYSYSTATVDANNRNGHFMGGLVGRNQHHIIDSYAAGPVRQGTGINVRVGGFVGNISGGSVTITNSYCDTQITGQTNCIGDTSGGASATVPATSTAALQTPTGYAAIYANWNRDLDGNGTPDFPWRFEGPGQYPQLNTPAQRLALSPITDYDANDNGLIDVSSLAQLDAIRHDLDGNGQPATATAYNSAFPARRAAAPGHMGCPVTCNGYELMQDLDFDSDASGAVDADDAFAGNFTPIGGAYSSVFEGNGHALHNLTIDQSGVSRTGLFVELNPAGRIRNLGLVNPNVAGGGQSAAYIGAMVANNRGVIAAGYVAGGAVSAKGTTTLAPRLGGLTGYTGSGGAIRASYATAALSTAAGNAFIGGLTGDLVDGGVITASYAAAPSITDGGTFPEVGGLVGRIVNDNSRINHSYCDITRRSGDCVGGRFQVTNPALTQAPGKTTAELQEPTDYEGIYRHWNIDLDGDYEPDYPWDFGAAGQYPKLNTPARRAALTPSGVDYDVNNNRLIEIRNLAQLNAIRHDLNGNGDATHGDYVAAFPHRDTDTETRMGCPAGACAGYELMADLDFSATGSPYNPWTPIGGRFTATFDGNGHTLANMKIEVTGGGNVHTGLFRQVDGGGHIREVGLLNPAVTSTVALSLNNGNIGALVGRLDTGGRIDRSYVQGGRIHASGQSAYVGGLTGYARGRIRASYSTAAVDIDSVDDYIFAGGLVGWVRNAGRITASYAAGPVTDSAGGGTNSYFAGLVGYVTHGASISAGYCDRQVSTRAVCVGATASSPGVIEATATTTAALQAPTGYAGIYANWNIDTDGDGNRDNPWDFGTPTDYPTLRILSHDSPPPGGPRHALPPQDTPYDPAADHPEIYENDRYEMSADCAVQYNADGAPESSTITFDLGTYRGQVILHLAQWNGEFFMSYESQDIAMPPFERDGQTATVRVTTDPAQTRFLLDSVSPTTNLVLGYADCHTDDPGAEPESTESTVTSTDATPPAPKVYINDQYEMMASCEVQNNADGEAESALITFDLGSYQGDVLLTMSLWNGEYYTSYESQDIDPPLLERDGQSATVRVATNPAETRFLLDGTPNGLRMNLLLGYADCHTAGE